MALHFQPYGNPFAGEELEQKRWDNLNQTLGDISNQSDRNRQFNMEQALREQEAARQRKEFSWKEAEYNRMNTPQGQQSGWMDGQSQMEESPQSPMGDQFPTPLLGGTTAYQEGPQTPQNGPGSSIIDLHKQQNPHLSHLWSGDQGLQDVYSNPNLTPRQVAEQEKRYGTGLEYQKTGAEIGKIQSEADLARSRAGNLRSTGSEFGKAPAGFRWTKDGNLEAISGGPADLKYQEAQKKADAALSGQKDKAMIVIGKIDQALSKISGWNTGGMSSTKNVPFVGQATGATDVAADLDTIKALLGFEQLGEMKNQSRAGASGLGALSDREMNLLTSARANLDQAQNQQQLKERLNEVKTHFNNWLKMEEGVNPYENGSGNGGPQIGEVRKGYRFKGGNPADKNSWEKM